jgi:hypothetical protein
MDTRNPLRSKNRLNPDNAEVRWPDVRFLVDFWSGLWIGTSHTYISIVDIVSHTLSWLPGFDFRVRTRASGHLGRVGFSGLSGPDLDSGRLIFIDK